MKILVTGAKGFVGKNLCSQLKNIRDGKARNYGLGPKEMPGQAGHGGHCIDEVYEYDLDSAPEESSFFTSIGHPFPAVCIRTSTERPEALDKGCFVLSGIDTIGLLQSVDVAVSLIRDGLPGIPVPDYVDENVSTKVVRIIQSYVGVVNKMVWRKF